MASYEGVPSIRLEGDQERALALIPEAKVFLQQIQAFVQRAGVPTYSSTRRLDDDAYVYVLCAGGQNIIHISVGVDEVDRVYEEPDVPPSRLFPDFLSGLVIDGIIGSEITDDGKTRRFVKSFAPTPSCARVHGLPSGRQSSSRLAVEPLNTFTEWFPKPPDERLFTQYVAPRASQWSGTMKKVVQVVMGLGRIDPAKMRDPKDVATKAQDSAYLQDVKTEGVQIRYDYKFSRTHGIHRGPDGVLWLVEISVARGVIAMRLPIFPDSDKPGFKNRAIARTDTAMEKVLDDLGCLPTGQGFPSSSNAFNRAKARGDILELLPASGLADFYANSGYSSACGWSFNIRGNEAHNVGYRYTDQTRLQQGVWYQINIGIGPVNHDRKPGEPIAVGSASLVKQHDSYIRPTLGKGFCPFKYYEPLIFGLMNHNAQPLPPPNLNPGGPSAAPGDTIDVPVFVGFVGDDLKVARLFGGKSGGPSDPPETDITPGECLYDGFWTTTTYTGGKSVPWAMYTNDFDRRRVLHPSVRVETYESQGQAHDPLYWSDYLFNPNFCYVLRRKPFKVTTTYDVKGGETLKSVLIVPGYLRDGYYFAEGRSFMTGHYGRKQVFWNYLTDPNVAFGYRNLLWLDSWKPWGNSDSCSTEACGGKHEERRVVCLVKYPGECSDFADSGPFMKMCEIIEAYPPKSPIPNRPDYSETWDAGQDFEGALTLMMDGLGGGKKLPFTEGQFGDALAVSPDPDSRIVQKMFAHHSAIGGDSAMYQTYIDSLEVGREGYFPTTLDNVDRLPAYIGVNQP